MAKVRVAILGTVGKAVRIETDATIGATLGVDLFAEDGVTLLTRADFSPSDESDQAAASEGAAGDHGLLTGLADDDHPQYAEHANTETISAVWTFTAQPVGIEHASLDLLAADDHLQYFLLAGRSGGQVAYGGLDAGDVLDLQGSDNADVGIVRINSPVTFTYDTFSNTTPAQQFLMNWAPTVAASGAYIGGALQTAAVFTVTTGVFIPAIFSDTNRYNIAAAPGFSAITFINELSTVANSGNFNLPSALVMNIGLTHERNSTGTSTTPGTTGISFSPQTRATVSGAVMTKTDQTAVRCSVTYSTVAGSTVNLGTIRGVHVFNVVNALFQPGAGIETATGIIGVDVNNLTFGGNITKAAVRSAHISTGTLSYFLLNNGTARSYFGNSNIEFNDLFGAQFGNSLDLGIGYVNDAMFLNFTGLGTGTAGQLRISSETPNTTSERFLFDSISGDAEFNFNCNRATIGAQVGAIGNGWFQFIAPARTTSINGDWSDILISAAGNLTVANTMGTVASQVFNAPSITGGGGTAVTVAAVQIGGNAGFATTNRVGLHILSNPTGGAGVNAALWLENGPGQFDGGFIVGDGTGDTVTFTHDGTDLNIANVGTTDWNITGLTGRLITDSGFEVTNNIIDLNNSGAATASTIINRNSAGGVTLNVNATTGNAQIGQTSGAGAAEDVWINFVRNAQIDFRHNNIAVARTALLASGGFEVNNTVTGAGYERALTTSDLSPGGPLPAGTIDDVMLRWDTTASAWEQEPQIRISELGTFQLLDSGLTDSMSMVHDGTDFNVVFLNTADYNLGSGLTNAVKIDADVGLQVIDGGVAKFNVTHVASQVQVRDGYELRISDAADTDFVTMGHDGANFNIVGTNTAFIDITGITTLRADGAIQTTDGDFIMQSVQNKVRFQETGQGADLGNSLIRQNGSDVGLWSATDAAPGTVVARAWEAVRGTTTTWDQIDIWTDLRLLDPAGADAMRFNLDGTDVNITHAGISAWNITDLSEFNVVNYNFDVDQAIGAGQDDFVLTYDDASGQIRLEAAPGGGSVTGTGALNQLAIWSGASSLVGDADLTFDGTVLTFGGAAANPQFMLEADATINRASMWTRTVAGVATKFLTRGSSVDRLNFGEASFALHLRGSTKHISDQAGAAQLRFEDAASTDRWLIGTSGAANDDFIIFDIDSGTSVLSFDDTSLLATFNNNVDISNSQLRITSGADSMSMSHNGTDMSFTYTNTTWQRFIGLGSGVLFQDGAELRVYETTDVNYVRVAMDSLTTGVIYVAGTNANALNIGLTGTLVNLPSVTDVDLTSTTHPFQIGLTSSTNLRMDNNEILCVANGVASALNLQTNGGDVNIGVATAAQLQLFNGGDLIIRDAGSLIIQDAFDTDTVAFQHNGTNLNTTFVNTQDWDIINLTGGFRLRDGAELQIFNGGDSDSATFSHDGTDFLTTFVNTIVWRVHDVGIVLDNAAAIWGRNFADTSEVALVRCLSDDAVRVGGTTGFNTVETCFGAIVETQTQDSNALGNTAGLQVQDHDQNMRDVGFNDLPIFNSNVSDTLEARHSGSMQLKSTTTARTLTLAAVADVDFPVGHMTQLMNGGTSGDYTVTEGASTTLFYNEPGTGLVDTTGGCTVGPGGTVTIYRAQASVYYIWGSEISYTP